jgi:TRAP transporter TAXI family solute receptor
MIGLALCGAMTMAAKDAAAQKFVVVGGGSTTGVYYQVALNVCKIINDNLGGKGYNCIGRPALGSVFNIRSIQRGLLNYGVAQSDRVWQAANGTKDWKGKPDKGLRTVFSVHPEAIMLVTRKDTGIKTIADLKGKRVNIGNPGSGQRGNALDVLRLSGIDKDKDIKAEGLQQNEANRALVDKKIDAFFYTIGVPWGGGLEIANSTAIDIVPVNTAPIQKLVADNPYYVMTAIPGGTYKGVDKDVPTYAVKATFVTGEKEPADSVYQVVKTIFENLDTLRNSYANFKNLQPKDMLKGLSAPMHPGAVKYYKEKGWM